MSEPPRHLSDEELVSALATRPRPSRIVDFPGLENGRVRIMVPVMRDHQEARSLAEATVRKELKYRLNREPTADDLSSHVSQQLIGDETAMELMSRCCWSVEPIGGGGEDGRPPVYKRLFADAAWLRNNLDADQIAILFTEWQLVVRECGPRYSTLSESDLDLWIERLKAGAWTLGPLAFMDSLDLAELCLSACKEISELRSSGSPTPESPSGNSPSSSESTSDSSPTGTTSFGGPAGNSAPGTSDLISLDEATAIARSLPR